MIRGMYLKLSQSIKRYLGETQSIEFKFVPNLKKIRKQTLGYFRVRVKFKINSKNNNSMKNLFSLAYKVNHDNNSALERTISEIRLLFPNINYRYFIIVKYFYVYYLKRIFQLKKCKL